MNHERRKIGFFAQVSNESGLSGVSTTHSLDELSSAEFLTHQCAEIDAMASRIVDESRIRSAINSAVSDCQFCVSIADPRDADFPLIAVSEKFQTITGYSRSEVIGKNCRFLNHGCIADPGDLADLRSACVTGASFTAILTNRRKSGDLFFNLIDLRGLTVAQNPRTGEDLWFLIGIQADVTNVHSLQEAQADVEARGGLQQFQEVARGIRAKLTDELSALAVAGALATSFSVAPSVQEDVHPVDAWCLLPVPTWRIAPVPLLKEIAVKPGSCSQAVLPNARIAPANKQCALSAWTAVSTWPYNLGTDPLAEECYTKYLCLSSVGIMALGAAGCYMRKACHLGR